VKRFGRGDAGLDAGIDTCLARNAVGVAGGDEHGGDTAARCGKVAASDGDRRGDDLVGGEERGGGGSGGSGGDGEIEVSAGLDSGCGRAQRKPRGSPAEGRDGLKLIEITVSRRSRRARGGGNMLIG